MGELKGEVSVQPEFPIQKEVVVRKDQDARN